MQESIDDKQSSLNLMQSPLIAIIIAVIISALMTLISFRLFINSGARDTVHSFQQTISEESKSTSIELNSPLTNSSVNQIYLKIQSDINKHDDTLDFNAEELNNSSLGL